MRSTTPTNSTQTKAGNSSTPPLSTAAIWLPASRHTEKRASVSIIAGAVIRRTEPGASKGPGSAPGSPPGDLATRRIRKRATGPPTRPPSTRPKVAQASASSVAECSPYFSLNTAPQAAPVPWPPDSVIEPASSPTSGLRPSSLASTMPTTFCAIRKRTTTASSFISGRPP